MRVKSWKTAALFCLINVLFVPISETKAIQNRIISGEPAKPGSIPWQVILMEDEYDVLECGGSIIDKRWVLTAAHCFKSLDAIFMTFGTVELRDYTYNMTSEEISIHPKYNPVTYENDIALVKLPRPLKFSEDVQPISLPSRSEASESLVSLTAIISGFGHTDDYDLEISEVLLWAEVEIVKNSVCIAEYGENKISNTNICAIGAEGTNKSICSGDSGGALVALIADKPVQIGINSFVYQDECTKKHPSVYTGTSGYLDYISKVTGLKFT